MFEISQSPESTQMLSYIFFRLLDLLSVIVHLTLSKVEGSKLLVVLSSECKPFGFQMNGNARN